jgi:hypothetical protein
MYQTVEFIVLLVMPCLFKEPGASNNNTDGKAHAQCVVSLFESQWSTLQMVVLREILMSSIRAADPLTSWSAAARLLRSFYPLITPAGQSGLASSLSNSADRLPWGTRCADPCLPFIRHVTFSSIIIFAENMLYCAVINLFYKLPWKYSHISSKILVKQMV